LQEIPSFFGAGRGVHPIRIASKMPGSRPLYLIGCKKASFLQPFYFSMKEPILEENLQIEKNCAIIQCLICKTVK